jgi:hypothetical protein
MTPTASSSSPPEQLLLHRALQPLARDFSADMTVTPGRKQPICRTCNTPMAGHRRPHGAPVCPLGPLSGSPPPEQKYRPPPTEIIDDHDHHDEEGASWPNDDVLQRGRWHRTNPNWIDGHHPRPVDAHDGLDDAASDGCAPTEPLSDLGVGPSGLQAMAIKAEMSASTSGRGRVLHLSQHQHQHVWQPVRASPSPPPRAISPSASEIEESADRITRMFSVATVDIPAVQLSAKKQAVHANFVAKPRLASPSRRKEADERHWWAFMGKDQTRIDHIVQLQQRDHAGTWPMPTAPGYFHTAPPTPKGITLVQMVMVCRSFRPP